MSRAARGPAQGDVDEITLGKLRLGEPPGEPGDDQAHHDERAALLATSPEVYEAGWATASTTWVTVHLEHADADEVHELLEEAWRQRRDVVAVGRLDAVLLVGACLAGCLILLAWTLVFGHRESSLENLEQRRGRREGARHRGDPGARTRRARRRHRAGRVAHGRLPLRHLGGRGPPTRQGQPSRPGRRRHGTDRRGPAHSPDGLDPDVVRRARGPPEGVELVRVLVAASTGWPVWLLGFVWIFTFAMMVSGPDPWRATKSAWFWLMISPAGPIVLIAFLSLGGPTGLAPAPRRGAQRLTGGWAFLLFLLLKALVDAARARDTQRGPPPSGDGPRVSCARVRPSRRPRRSPRRRSAASSAGASSAGASSAASLVGGRLLGSRLLRGVLDQRVLGHGVRGGLVSAGVSSTVSSAGVSSSSRGSRSGLGRPSTSWRAAALGA